MSEELTVAKWRAIITITNLCLFGLLWWFGVLERYEDGPWYQFFKWNGFN